MNIKLKLQIDTLDLEDLKTNESKEVSKLN